MTITGTIFNYYFVCLRKVWLFANGISFEHTSDLVYEGKILHEDSYPQRSIRYEEIEIGGIKIDFYDAKNKVIHEIKKSNKLEVSHEWQLKYYIYVFEKSGILGVRGILEYPSMRITKQIELNETDRMEIARICTEIEAIASQEACPDSIKRNYCKSCSYYEFCYTND